MSDEVERDTLALFCADLDRLRALLRGPAGAQSRTVVERAVRAARRGEPVGELVAPLRAALHQADAVEYQGEVLPRGEGRPPRLRDVALPPVIGSYVCPAGRCNRSEVRRAGSPVPSCEVHEQALRFRSDGGPTR